MRTEQAETEAEARGLSRGAAYLAWLHTEVDRRPVAPLDDFRFEFEPPPVTAEEKVRTHGCAHEVDKTDPARPAQHAFPAKRVPVLSTTEGRRCPFEQALAQVRAAGGGSVGGGRAAADVERERRIERNIAAAPPGLSAFERSAARVHARMLGARAPSGVRADGTHTPDEIGAR